MFVNDTIDTFDVLMYRNIYGLKTNVFSHIYEDLVKDMYNCMDIVSGPMWSSWVNSLYTVNL